MQVLKTFKVHMIITTFFSKTCENFYILQHELWIMQAVIRQMMESSSHCDLIPRDEVRFLLSAFLCCLCVSPQRYVWVELLSTFDLDQIFSFKILHHEQMFDHLATSCCLA